MPIKKPPFVASSGQPNEHEDFSNPSNPERSLARSIQSLEASVGLERATPRAVALMTAWRIATDPERYEAGLSDLLTIQGLFQDSPYTIFGDPVSELVHTVRCLWGGARSNAELAQSVSFGIAVDMFRNELLKRIDSPMRRIFLR